MPHLCAFRGLRYAPSVPLEAVIAPPYDVIDERQRRLLAQRHPANAIHVELPVPDDAAGLDRYANAARLLSGWVRSGVVVRDLVPTLTVVQMHEPAGSTTTGVIGALGCDDAGDVLPHERTLPKDTSDRLELLRACQANLSPIWGLSQTRGLGQLLEPARPPDVQATDDDGVVHQAWTVDDQDWIRAVVEAVESSPVVIADGHHRYQTAVEHRLERRRAGAGPGPWDAVMTLVVELAPGQLSVGAIHRALNLGTTDHQLQQALSRFFDLRRIRADEATRAAAAAASGSGPSVVVSQQGAWLALPRLGSSSRPVPGLSSRAAQLAGLPGDAGASAGGLDHLDSALLDAALGELPDVQVTYHPDWRAAIATSSGDSTSTGDATGISASISVGTGISAGVGTAAVVLRPPTVEQIMWWASQRRRMPPKSTYFHPKPRTGMVFRPLDLRGPFVARA